MERRASPPGLFLHTGSGFSHPLPNLPRVMPPVDPVKLAPLVGCERSQEGVVHDFRPCAEPALAIVQTRGHSLKLRHNSSLNLFQRHSPRHHAFRALAACREITEIHHQQSGHAMLQRSPSSQRGTLLQAFRRSATGVLVREKKVFQDLGRIPLSSRSLRPSTDAGTPHCIFEFLPQTFKIGIHGVDSVQSFAKTRMVNSMSKLLQKA